MTKKLTDRQRFERWVKRYRYPTYREHEHFAWQVWQAAIRSERRRGR